MRVEHISADITIVGGGLAGVNAAIAAARNGRRVSLVTNRPVLGGNSSSEVRVWVVGATGHGSNHNAREGGIMGELFLENQYRNKDGNPYLWDALIYEKVTAEPLITLFLNTDVRLVDASGPADARTIQSVTGWTMASERLITFTSPVFVDASGDGLIGFLAGAEHRVGRESKDEFGESWAPETPDAVTLGSTLLFYTKDVGHPVRFVAPAFAKDIAATTIPHNRIIRSGDDGCAYWWIEFGGELDTVHDNERIRDELWSVVYGIWDHIKNSGEFDADSMTLEWVGSIPGKREYRRFVGDYMLTQNDVFEQRDFDDQVAFGGWSIDLHPPGGMYAGEDGAKQRYADGIYPIPYRSLYSRNVGNMFMAGRNISASHVAFGSTRVMATCATIGQAVGTAAAIAVEMGVDPRGVRVSELQGRLLRDDASVFGLAEHDKSDLARSAHVTASSAIGRLGSDRTLSLWPLEADAGLVVPVHHELSVLRLKVTAEGDAVLPFTVTVTDKPQNYVPGDRVVAAGDVAVTAGEQWIELPIDRSADTPVNLFVLLHATQGVALHLAERRAPGTFSFTRQPLQAKHEAPQKLREWSDRPFLGRGWCMEVDVDGVFRADRIVNGYLRPYGGPNMWVSEPLARDAEPWLCLTWSEPVEVNRVELIFDDDVNEDLINLHHHVTPAEIMPTLVRDYVVEGRADGQWIELGRSIDNRVRRVIHELSGDYQLSDLRVRVLSTNGVESAHIVAVRAFT